MENWPSFLEIGPLKYGFGYAKVSIGHRSIYICSRGSEYCRKGEILILTYESDHWVAWDGQVSSSGEVELRQPVFRTWSSAISPGWIDWEINHNAGPEQMMVSEPAWQRGGSFETRNFNARPSYWGEGEKP